MRKLFILSAAAALCVAAVPAHAADVEAGKAKFQQFCGACHGPEGHGDGPAAAALNPKPRSLDDTEWQESVDDDHIRKVIVEGGAAVGLSPMMTAWGHALKGDDLENVVAYIRSLDD